MPALQTVSFTGASANTYKPTYLGSGVWSVKCPDTPGALAASFTTSINLNFTTTIPTGYVLLVISPHDVDIPGAANCSVRPGLYKALTTNQINCLNVSGAGPTPTNGVEIVYFVMVKNNIEKVSITDPF